LLLNHIRENFYLLSGSQESRNFLYKLIKDGGLFDLAQAEIIFKRIVLNF